MNKNQLDDLNIVPSFCTLRTENAILSEALSTYLSILFSFPMNFSMTQHYMTRAVSSALKAPETLSM